MQTDTVLSAEELAALWRQLGDDESLTEPYELTEHGQIVMSPRPTNRHQLIAAEVAFQLRSQLGGKAATEAAVLTTHGVRVPDVVWMPDERWDVGQTLIVAPELVVEVLSPGNRKTEVQHKVDAYLEAGVREVLVVGVKGTLDFHRTGGVHRASAFALSLLLAPHLFE